MGVAVEIASPSVSVQTLFPLPVSWPTCEVAIEVSFVVSMHAQVSCIYADFEVFPVFRPPYWISGMCQIWFEGAIL